MMLTKEDVEKIVKAATAGLVGAPITTTLIEAAADKIARGIDDVQSIQRRVQIIRQEKNKLIEQCEVACRDLDKRLNEVQATCPHHCRTYYPDPAGGSDSHTSCDHCDKEIH